MEEKPIIKATLVWQMKTICFSMGIFLALLSIVFLLNIIKGYREYWPGAMLFSIFAYACFGNGLYRVVITDQSVTLTDFYGRFRILWDEVEKVMINPTFIALIGRDKRVVFSPAYSKIRFKDFLQVIYDQSKGRNIVIERNRSFSILQKNSGVLW